MRGIRLWIFCESCERVLLSFCLFIFIYDIASHRRVRGDALHSTQICVYAIG